MLDPNTSRHGGGRNEQFEEGSLHIDFELGWWSDDSEGAPFEHVAGVGYQYRARLNDLRLCRLECGESDSWWGFSERGRRSDEADYDTEDEVCVPRFFCAVGEVPTT